MTVSIELYEIADWMASVISNHDFGLTLEVERSYADWDDLLTEMDEIHVDVVPVGYPSSELDTRGAIADQNTIDIGIRKHFSLGDTQTNDGRIAIEEIDALVKLLRQIKKLLIKKRAVDDSEAIWKATAVTITFDRKMLRDHQQFLGIIRFTLDVYDEL